MGVLHHISVPGASVPTAGAPVACRFPVYVLATSEKGTRAALGAAQRYAANLDARIVVVVPHVAPYPADMQDSRVPATARAASLRRMVEAMTLNAEIVTVTCRRDRDVPAAAFPPDALVLVGGAARRRWHTKDQRLVASLTTAGYRALFVQQTP